MGAIAFAAGATERIKLPDIGASAGAIVSEQDERAYGEALMREFRRLAAMVDDPLVEEYIRHLGFSLVAHSDAPERRFSFIVVNQDSVNAFAAPGGFIAVHSGLILKADNESEVAAVVAHEVAHVTQRHLARAIESAQRMTLPMMLLMLGAAVAGAGDVDAMNTALIGGQALMAQMQINFTRANEYEADRVGIHTLAQAGYDPAGMAGFFGKMARLSRNRGEGAPEFLRTHPVETTRMAEATNRAKDIKVVDAPERDPAYFLLMRERLRVLTAERPQPLVVYYQRQISNGFDGVEHQYGLALAQLESGDTVGAAESLTGLAENLPGSVPIQITMARVEHESGNRSAALQRFQELKSRYPDNVAVVSGYVTALLEGGNASDARQSEAMLRPMLAEHPDEARLFLLYSRAADDAGMETKAGEAHAHYVFLQGRVYDALTQLRNLLRSPQLDYYQRSRLEARAAEWETILSRIDRFNGYDPSEGRRPGRLGLSLN